MKSSFSPYLYASFVFAFLIVQTAVASSSVEVRNVRFEKVSSSAWGRTRVSFRCSDSSLNSRFIDNVQLRINLAFGSINKGLGCFSAEVDIVSVEKGQEYCVDFFLPPVVFERDRVDYRPFAYFLQWYIDGKQQSLSPRFASKNVIESVDALRMFLEEVKKDMARNKGVLLPSYLAPYPLNFESSEKYPAYKRKVLSR